MDDATLAEWEKDRHPSLTITQERLREAIAEIRRLREELKAIALAVNAVMPNLLTTLEDVKADLAAYRAVVQRGAVILQSHHNRWCAQPEHGVPCEEPAIHAWLNDPLVQQAREEKI